MAFQVWHARYFNIIFWLHIGRHTLVFYIDIYDDFKRDIHQLFPYILDTKRIAFALRRHEVRIIVWHCIIFRLIFTNFL